MPQQILVQVQSKLPVQATVHQGCFSWDDTVVSLIPALKELTDSVCYFIAKDAQPLNTVNDKGFRHLLTSFEPRYVPPDCKAITDHYLPDLYVQQEDRISEEMAQTSYFAMTTDGWTSCGNESYLSLSITLTKSGYS